MIKNIIFNQIFYFVDTILVQYNGGIVVSVFGIYRGVFSLTLLISYIINLNYLNCTILILIFFK